MGAYPHTPHPLPTPAHRVQSKECPPPAVNHARMHTCMQACSNACKQVLNSHVSLEAFDQVSIYDMLNDATYIADKEYIYVVLVLWKGFDDRCLRIVFTCKYCMYIPWTGGWNGIYLMFHQVVEVKEDNMYIWSQRACHIFFIVLLCTIEYKCRIYANSVCTYCN